MNRYVNCEKPESVHGPVVCGKCGTKHKIEYDSIKAPYKESGTEKCHGCGIELLKWNSTTEPYLKRIG